MPAPSLERKVFTTSRLAEFCSASELEKQTGHAPGDWPLVVLKELIDNATDEAEKAGIAPVIEVTVDNGYITVADNGPGIAPAVVAKVLDFNVRVSDKEAYVSPTRGAQGNALKTIVAMPFALDGQRGETTIEARGIEHSIAFSIDPVRRIPRISHQQNPGPVKNGTRITVGWPFSARSQLDSARSEFLLFAENYALINPHLTLRVTWNGVVALAAMAGNPKWQKWTPADPIPPHWYTPDRFDRNIAVHIAHDQDHGGKTTVREYVKSFAGLSGSPKLAAVLDDLGASRLSLADFYQEGRNHLGVERLLIAMQQAAKPVNEKSLGIIGRENIEQFFATRGAEAFQYRRQTRTVSGLPYIVETAFGWIEDGDNRLITGINFSATILNPFRTVSYGNSLAGLLAAQYAGSDEPVMVLVHLVCPRLSFTDRGKTALALNGFGPMGRIGEDIAEAVRKMTDPWAKARKAEIRDASAAERRRERLNRSRRVSIKDAAYAVMERSYLHASSNNTLPANARQIMYAARPHIQEATGKQLDDKYFTQTLLPDYMANRGVDWNVVFDDRGHFTEPHGGAEIGLGTLNVRRYLKDIRKLEIEAAGFASAKVSTRGPDGNYGAVLYVEKEGFDALFEAARLANRFDISMMSTKGMSVTAARELAERLCGERGIPLFILHDFDKAGLSILSTMQRDTRRYKFRETLNATDIGLRFDDVRSLNLEDSAERAYDEGSREARTANLKLNGASIEEIDFLLDRRVELNALTSQQLVDLVEEKLTEHGVRKIIPPDDVLAKAYESFLTSKEIKKIVERAIKKASKDEVEIPKNLRDRITDHLSKHPEMRWDEALAEIAELD
jgi:DNA topoisomerase VI subunit B